MPANNATDAEATARSLYDALSTGDTTLVDKALAPGWEAVPAMRTGPGADGWKKSIEHLRGVFSNLTVTVEEVIVAQDGNHVAVRTACRGVHDGELLGVPGTGRTVEFRACDTHRLEDGKIVKTWHLEDYFGLATQLGLKFSL